MWKILERKRGKRGEPLGEVFFLKIFMFMMLALITEKGKTLIEEEEADSRN